jgi:hypothetical protein
MTTYLSPTDVEFYADHDTAVLEFLVVRTTREGAFIAANSGADHPMAKANAEMLAAIIGALVLRELRLESG